MFTLPTLNTTQAAVDTLSTSLPNGEDDWANVSVTNAPGTNSYPISSMTYLLVYRELNVYGAAMTQVKAKALVAFLWWAVHDGQQFSEPLSYVKLPAGVVTVDERTIGLITYNGQPLRG